MFTSPAIDAVGTGLIGRGHHDLWRSRVRGLPESAGELPVAALREEIETPGDGQIRAMLTLAGNPVLSTPDGARLDAVLADLDFMAAVDIYVNETTRHAHVILPPTTALERDHYDLIFHTLAVRNTARFTPAVLPAGPDTRHDWQIYKEIALRTAARLPSKAPLKKRLARRLRLSTSPTVLIGLLLRRGRQRGHPQAAAGQPVRRRPRAPAAGTAPGGPAHEGQADRPRPARSCSTTSPGSTRWPRPARASCSSSDAGTSRTATPGCTTPSG